MCTSIEYERTLVTSPNTERRNVLRGILLWLCLSSLPSVSGTSLCCNSTQVNRLIRPSHGNSTKTRHLKTNKRKNKANIIIIHRNFIKRLHQVQSSTSLSHEKTYSYRHPLLNTHTYTPTQPPTHIPLLASTIFTHRWTLS